MRRRPTAPRAQALVLALPHPAAPAWHEWAVALGAVALLLAALLSR
ncbi:hypothetical protein [Anaeromyxobacter terrae]|nr:hypothetical protein [Anaeromyxobacter sp. SG22]